MTKIKDSQGGPDYEPASATVEKISGVYERLREPHDAVCAEFGDLGTKPTPYGDKHQGVLVFQLDEMQPEGERRKEVRLYFNMTWGTDSMPSKVRETVEGWRGREFASPEEREGFDLERLEGQACQLDLEHRQSKDKKKTYANVVRVHPAGKKTMKVVGYKPLADRGQSSNSDAGASSDDSDVPF
jgi:hypothetical protein